MLYFSREECGVKGDKCNRNFEGRVECPVFQMIILKVYCSYLFDCARLEMGNFTFSQGAPALSVEVKEYKVEIFLFLVWW